MNLQVFGTKKSAKTRKAENLYDFCMDMLISVGAELKSLEKYRFVKGAKEYSLLEMLKKTDRVSYDRRWSLYRKTEAAYNLICTSMEEYIEDLPGPYSLKKQRQNKFLTWLQAIVKKYQIQEPYYPEAFRQTYYDTTMEMLKMLQDPNGVTKLDIAGRLQITDRAVLKTFCKLDHSLGESEQTHETVRIGDQPVHVKIKAFRNPGQKVKRYKTVNTVHPVILQENVMQVGTLIQSLARNYIEYENDTSYFVGLDIWSQLTDYAKERIRMFFTAGDPAVEEFITILEDDSSDERVSRYYTEREMLEEANLRSKEELLIYYIKTSSRRGNIVLEKPEGRLAMHNVSIVQDRTGGSGEEIYKAVQPDGKSVLFTKNQLIDIE